MEHNTEHNDMHDVKWGFGLDSDPQKRLLFSSSTEVAPKEEGQRPDGQQVDGNQANAKKH